jgi:hypothetical protein
MENREKEKAIRLLEKLRTNQSVKPKPTASQPFAYEHRRWFNKLSGSIVMTLVLSASLTVFANHDQPSKQEVNQTEQVQPKETKEKRVASETIDHSPSGEAALIEFKEKEESSPTRRSSVKRSSTKKKRMASKKNIRSKVVSQAKKKKRRTGTQLYLPPQPKVQDKPAKYDTPIQIPEDYRKRISQQARAEN